MNNTATCCSFLFLGEATKTRRSPRLYIYWGRIKNRVLDLNVAFPEELKLIFILKIKVSTLSHLAVKIEVFKGFFK